MTRFKLLGAALILAAIAAPASAQEAISEPAAAASQNPNFNIYSSGGAFGSSRPIASQPFNTDAMAQMRVSARPHRAHHKHY